MEQDLVASELAKAAAVLSRCRAELKAAGSTDAARHLLPALRSVRAVRASLAATPAIPDLVPADEDAEDWQEDATMPASALKAFRAGRRRRHLDEDGVLDRSSDEPM